MQNLQAHVEAATRESPDVESYDASAPYPIWHVVRNDSYESSRLVLPGFLASFRDKVAGNPIAIVPHRSLLVISGDGHSEAVARLAHMTESEFDASPRAISPAVYGLNAAGDVVPLALPNDHPSCNVAERGHGPPCWSSLQNASYRSRASSRRACASSAGPAPPS
jgi:hypothetical protein